MNVLKGYCGIEKMADAGPGISVDAGAKALADALERTRNHKDEMEKLIGVRELDQHPNGISGAVLALLGVTDKLEAKCSAQWKDFVIGRLINYLNGIGTTPEIMAKIAENHAARELQLAEAFTDYTNQVTSIPLDTALVDKYKRLSPTSILTPPLQRMEAFIIDVVQEEWKKVVYDPALKAADYQRAMSDVLGKELFYRDGENGNVTATSVSWSAPTLSALIDFEVGSLKAQLHLTLDANKPMANASVIAK